MGATNRQKMFADYFLETGNAEQSAIRAGYSERYARGHAHRLRYQPTIVDYIDKRLEELASERIASVTEIMEYLTNVMRGKSMGEIVVVEGTGDGCSDARRMTKAPDERERLKAAELLGRRYGMFTDKLNVDGAVPIMFVGEDEIED